MTITAIRDSPYDENAALVTRVSELRGASQTLIEENRRLRRLVAELRRENDRLHAITTTPSRDAQRADRVRSMLRASRNP
jgi:hypothetical protein